MPRSNSAQGPPVSKDPQSSQFSEKRAKSSMTPKLVASYRLRDQPFEDASCGPEVPGQNDVSRVPEPILRTYASSNTVEVKKTSAKTVRLARDLDAEPLHIGPRKSKTFNSLPGSILQVFHSNKSPDEVRLKSEWRKLRSGFQWSRTCLDPRHRFRDRLDNQLKLAMKSSHLIHQSFLPCGKLNELCTQKSFEKELSKRKYYSRKGAQLSRDPRSIAIEQHKSPNALNLTRSKSDSVLDVKRPVPTYRMIFAILVFVGKLDKIWSFFEEGVCDSDLPLEEFETVRDTQTYLSLRQRWYPNKRLRCFEGWCQSALRGFAENQWVVLAPVFKRSVQGCVPHFELHPKTILPFQIWEPLRKGGCGRVFKVRIHPDHHEFDSILGRQDSYKRHFNTPRKRMKSSESRDIFAIKQLMSRREGVSYTKEAFERESRVLKNLSQERHTDKHLIILLATYELDSKYYLIFPWAEMDLQRFWEKSQPNRDMVTWVIEQCQGLARALDKIHRYSTYTATSMMRQTSRSSSSTYETQRTSSDRLNLIGRHGDIKPQNILWFPEGKFGVLKITDFGIAQFSPENMESAKRKGWVPNSPSYRSPECDIEDSPIGPQCDIWALGCVYLVFVTWLFGGWNRVDSFARRRLASDKSWHREMEMDNFFTFAEDASGKKKPKVKDAVVQMIDELQSHTGCTDNVSKLLCIVKDDMLIIQNTEPDGSLRVSNKSSMRISSGNLARKLGSF